MGSGIGYGVNAGGLNPPPPAVLADADFVFVQTPSFPATSSSHVDSCPSTELRIAAASQMRTCIATRTNTICASAMQYCKVCNAKYSEGTKMSHKSNRSGPLLSLSIVRTAVDVCLCLARLHLRAHFVCMNQTYVPRLHRRGTRYSIRRVARREALFDGRFARRISPASHSDDFACHDQGRLQRL